MNCLENGLVAGTSCKTTVGCPSVCMIDQLVRAPVDPDPSNITTSLGLAFLINSVNLASTFPVGGGGGGGGGGRVVPL
jgi:hypothetical protein